MDFEITPLSNGFGAEVTGLDLSQTLSYDDFETLRRVWFEAGVVVFRDQNLTPGHQVAFSRRFGPLIVHVLEQFQQPGQPEILLISNKKREDGTALGFEEAGRYWHSDLSYVEKPAFGSLLYAVEIPPEGGDTMFADMRGAVTWGSEGVELIASDQMEDEMAAAIASISHTVTNDSGSVRVRLHDKLRALEKLGRHLGLFDGQGSQDPYESAQRIKNALREMLKRTKVPKPSASTDGESQS